MTRKGRSPRGERNGNAKLTEGKVREIRLVWSKGGVTKGDLGRRYGVTGALVGLVVNGKQWKHVA